MYPTLFPEPSKECIPPKWEHKPRGTRGCRWRKVPGRQLCHKPRKETSPDWRTVLGGGGGEGEGDRAWHLRESGGLKKSVYRRQKSSMARSQRLHLNQQQCYRVPNINVKKAAKKRWKRLSLVNGKGVSIFWLWGLKCYLAFQSTYMYYFDKCEHVCNNLNYPQTYKKKKTLDEHHFLEPPF